MLRRALMLRRQTPKSHANKTLAQGRAPCHVAFVVDQSDYTGADDGAREPIYIWKYRTILPYDRALGRNA